jgi:RNA polymerase sigma factor (sigma-70 family)
VRWTDGLDSGGDRRTDGELLTASVHEPEAFGAFYDRHVEAVLAYFAKRTGDPEAAADLTSETFAQALISRGKYRDIGPPARSWLIGIARHQLLRFFRRKRVEDRARRAMGIERLGVDETSYERIEALADLAPIREAIREGIRALPPKLGDAVVLRLGQNLPYEEVALKLGCSEGTARVRVARGLARLADRMEVFA